MGRYLSPLLKLAVTVGLLAWLASGVDLGQVRERLAAVGVPAALAATMVLAMLIPATAARWGVVQHAIAAPLPGPALLRLTLVGLFFNQLLPAPIGEIGRAHVELQSLMRISYAVFCLKKKK